MMTGAYIAEDHRPEDGSPRCSRIVYVGAGEEAVTVQGTAYRPFLLPLPDADDPQNGTARWTLPQGAVTMRRVTLGDYNEMREEDPALPEVDTEFKAHMAIANVMFQDIFV